MKKLIFLIILCTYNINAVSIKWFASYDKALKQAHKDKKNMMLFIISSSSKKSKQLLKTVFLNKRNIDYLNKNYINILINVDYKTSYPIELFYTTNYPSLFFASYKDESFLIDPIYGLKNKEEFNLVLKKLKKKE